MKLPLSWLNEYVSTEGYTPEQLADKLLNIGFEVEEIIYLGEGIDKVVVGRITEIKKHEQADKLQVCSVDVGTEVTTIVTGATNVAVGNYVPVALDGATLPCGKEIRSAPLRGVMSYGMMCSGKELGVDDNVIDGAEVNGILLLPQIREGTDVKEVLRLNDYVLDVSVTANRPDCQSIYGMAREVSAVLGRKLKPLDLKYKSVPTTMLPSVEICADACSRYSCRVIENVTIARSPEWMRDRLRAVGVRAINNVVDITNYVLFEVGQPLHAFDTDFVKDLSIVVRTAGDKEKITALDGNVYELNNSMLVIADNEKPLAIAGVMGGEYSGINDGTTSVLLEAARFAKGSVRTTSRTLGLRSDSSARYEKGVDYMSVDVGRERALALFHKLKAGTVTDAFAEANTQPAKHKTIVTSAKKISELLGIEIKSGVITKILKSLSFGVTVKGKDIIVDVPLFREDMDNYTDIAEEVIRYYGYDNIKSTFLPTAKTTAGGLDTRLENINLVKSLMCGFGAYEISTYSFIGKKAADKLNLPSDSILRRQIEILNPLGEEYSLMRTQLASSMLGVLAGNFSKKNKDFRLFEVSKTYMPHALPLSELPDEVDTLCVAFTGAAESFYTIKSVATTLFEKFAVKVDSIEYTKCPYLHPGMGCDYVVDGKTICTLGKLHPTVAENYDVTEDVYLCEINLSGFISKRIPLTEFVPLPKFQAVERDLAVVVKEDVTVGSLLATVKTACPLSSDVKLFDVYRGEQIESGFKSVALSFKLSAPDRTLKDEEINACVNDILKALDEKFGAKLR